MSGRRCRVATDRRCKRGANESRRSRSPARAAARYNIGPKAFTPHDRSALGDGHPAMQALCDVSCYSPLEPVSCRIRSFLALSWGVCCRSAGPCANPAQHDVKAVGL